MKQMIFSGMCILWLVGCATTSPTPDQATKNMMSEMPKKELGRLNTPVHVKNIVSIKDAEQTINSQTYLIIEIRTADNKIYHGQQKIDTLTNEERAKIRTMKEVELIGIIPLQDRIGEFSFRALQNPIY